jgi:hypothetical protein
MKTKRTFFRLSSPFLAAACLAALAHTSSAAEPGPLEIIPDADIPYPAALDAAAVVQDRLDNLQRRALPIGNGDINALFWDRDGALCLRVAKNDIWDARVDTSGDGPLMTVDVPNQKWSGSLNRPPSWAKKPYPSPRSAAIVRIGAKANDGGVWRCIRPGGTAREWSRRGDTGVMAIEGRAGSSAGWRWDMPSPVEGLTALKLRLSGTPGAQFFVNINGETQKEIIASEWRDTPVEEQEISIAVPATMKVTAVELYVQTKDGSRAENHVQRIVFEGDKTSLALPPKMGELKAMSAKLDLRRAVAVADGVSVRALANRNVFLIETDRDVSLEEIKSEVLPDAEVGETDGVKWLHMKMPGDPEPGDYAGMEYAFAVAANGTHKAVAVVTSRDTSENVRDAAVRLARETAAAEVAVIVAEHEAEWARYWAASGVELDDPDFQLWWYRMVYVMRCQSKPGVMPSGLWTFQPTDRPLWHGDYHHNYNAWQPNWASFIVNHPGVAEPWMRYMKEMLPRMRWFAKTTYDCEGAFVGVASFAFEPDPANSKSVNRRQIAIPPYGYTLGMMGMSAQVLWYSHLYQPDRKVLEETVYPVIRDTALFYASFAEKCPRSADGKVQFGPSYSPEHGKFGVADVPYDLAYARFSMDAAIAAAGELGQDADLVVRWRKAIELLPPYPTAPDAEGKPVVVDWAGCQFDEVKIHNITVPVVPVFPGDQVTWFSPEPEKELFARTIRQTRHNGNNSVVMFSVAKARLSMPEAGEDARAHFKPTVQPNGMFKWQGHGYYLTESVGIAAMISEYLLQSVDNTIRVFPCWPKDKDASFTNLRAQGGFLVTAEQKAGKVTKLEVHSTVGGNLRLLNPWTDKIVEYQTKQNEKLDLKP